MRISHRSTRINYAQLTTRYFSQLDVALRLHSFETNYRQIIATIVSTVFHSIQLRNRHPVNFSLFRTVWTACNVTTIVPNTTPQNIVPYDSIRMSVVSIVFAKFNELRPRRSRRRKYADKTVVQKTRRMARNYGELKFSKSPRQFTIMFAK